MTDILEAYKKLGIELDEAREQLASAVAEKEQYRVWWSEADARASSAISKTLHCGWGDKPTCSRCGWSPVAVSPEFVAYVKKLL